MHVFQKHVCPELLHDISDMMSTGSGFFLAGHCTVFAWSGHWRTQFCIAFVSFCMVLVLLWNCKPGFHTEFCMQLATCCLDNCFEKSGISTVSTLAQGLHNDVCLFLHRHCAVLKLYPSTLHALWNVLWTAISKFKLPFQMEIWINKIWFAKKT